MKKEGKVGRPKKRPKESKAIIVDFGGKVIKARFINTTNTYFRGSDVDKAYKAMRRGLREYKIKLRAKLDKERLNG